jgi:hypothetical protein
LRDTEEAVSRDTEEAASRDTRDTGEAASRDTEDAALRDTEDAASRDTEEAVSRDTEEAVSRDTEEAALQPKIKASYSRLTSYHSPLSDLSSHLPLVAEQQYSLLRQISDNFARPRLLLLHSPLPLAVLLRSAAGIENIGDMTAR